MAHRYRLGVLRDEEADLGLSAALDERRAEGE